ncbi:AAA family ATPase [Burkholderia sp. Ac-20345]|uniref:ExeA family protein n=1 Tax=Burkholderia sp. Ac-20345 TaxID=2703891 RepID=UPI00197C3284|nr:AAA family ATPase [Burkholderia sp. Ac-20345]MBN3779938.1 AAA family ATPase [Burkholderia sp. Ac-20345]
MLKLAHILKTHQISMARLASMHPMLSRTPISLLLNHGHYPARKSEFQSAVQEALMKCGVTADEAAAAFKKTVDSGKPANPPIENGLRVEDEVVMLIRKVTLSAEALTMFGLSPDRLMPPQGTKDVFMGQALRRGFEHMSRAARFGGFLALIGESGAGKSTLKGMLADELGRHGEVVVIEPMVIGMDQNDKKGKTLKAAHIATAILREIAPYVRPALTLEARSKQVYAALIQAKTDNPKRRHLLVIEEAHRLPVPTLKHLKNFYELSHNGSPLLSILLLGQPELDRRLSPLDMEIREVWQRCEIVRLSPLDGQLADYLKFRLGAKAAAAFKQDAIDALTDRLCDPASKRSYLYPLAVDNWIAATMNVAAKIGSQSITAETVAAAYKRLNDEYRQF